MKNKYILSVICCLSFFYTYAVVWCPSGAIWTYRVVSFLGRDEGVMTFAYKKDTIIYGKDCKQLEGTGHYYSSTPSGIYYGPFNYFTRYLYTYQSGDSIFYYDNNVWQLKYVFNQAINTNIYTDVIASTDTFFIAKLKQYIIDTTGVVSGSFYLKKYESIDTVLSIDSTNPNYQYCSNVHSKVIERVGNTDFSVFDFYTCGNIIADAEIFQLVCYRDYFGEFYHRDTLHNCDYIYNNIQDLNNKYEFSIFPNPSTDKVYIESMPNISDNNNLLKIYDIHGKIILTRELNFNSSNLYTIDFSQYSSGMYIFSIGNYQERIVKIE